MFQTESEKGFSTLEDSVDPAVRSECHLSNKESASTTCPTSVQCSLMTKEGTCNLYTKEGLCTLYTEEGLCTLYSSEETVNENLDVALPIIYTPSAEPKTNKKIIDVSDGKEKSSVVMSDEVLANNCIFNSKPTNNLLISEPARPNEEMHVKVSSHQIMSTITKTVKPATDTLSVVYHTSDATVKPNPVTLISQPLLPTLNTVHPTANTLLINPGACIQMNSVISQQFPLSSIIYFEPINNLFQNVVTKFHNNNNITIINSDPETQVVSKTDLEIQPTILTKKQTISMQSSAITSPNDSILKRHLESNSLDLTASLKVQISSVPKHTEITITEKILSPEKNEELNHNSKCTEKNLPPLENAKITELTEITITEKLLSPEKNMEINHTPNCTEKNIPSLENSKVTELTEITITEKLLSPEKNMELNDIPKSTEKNIPSLENSKITEFAYEDVVSTQVPSPCNSVVIGSEENIDEISSAFTEDGDNDYDESLPLSKRVASLTDHAYYAKQISGDCCLESKKTNSTKEKVNKKSNENVNRKSARRTSTPNLHCCPKTPTVASPKVVVLIQCEKCGEKFDTWMQKRNHINNRRHYPGWFCYPCNKRFGKLLDFWAHGCSHKKEKTFVLVDGMGYHGMDKEIWQCEVCKQLYFSREMLLNHIVKCKLECNLCNKEFVVAEEYRVHYINCQNQMQEEAASLFDENLNCFAEVCVIHCKYCATPFSKKEVEEFKRHVLTCAVETNMIAKLDEKARNLKSRFRHLWSDVKKNIVKKRKQEAKPCDKCRSSEPVSNSKRKALKRRRMSSFPESVGVGDKRIKAPRFQPYCSIEKLNEEFLLNMTLRKTIREIKKEIIEYPEEEFSIPVPLQIKQEIVDDDNGNFEAPSLQGTSSPNDLWPDCPSPQYNFIISDVRGGVDFFGENESQEFAMQNLEIVDEVCEDFEQRLTSTASPKRKRTSPDKSKGSDEFEINVANILDMSVRSKPYTTRSSKKNSRVCSKCAHRFPNEYFDDHPCDWLMLHLKSCYVKLQDVLKVKGKRRPRISNFNEILKNFKETGEKQQMEVTNQMQVEECQQPRENVDMVIKKEVTEDNNQSNHELVSDEMLNVRENAMADLNMSRRNRKRAAKRRRDSYFKDYLLLQKVRKELKSNENNKSENSQSEINSCLNWNYICNVCEEKFFLKKIYDAHLRTHLELFPFRCNKCGNAFTTQFYLDKHVSFSGKNMRKCRECTREFCTENSFNEHVHLHKLVKLTYLACGSSF